MKKRFTAMLAMLMLVPLSAFASGQHNLSLWFKSHNGEVTLIPWYTYDGAYSVDTRYNFDLPRTTGGFVGKAFQLGPVVLTPYVGGMLGDAEGISVQGNAFAKLGRWDMFLLNQYAWMREQDAPDFLYHWGDFLTMSGDHLAFGASEQLYREPGSDAFLDIGPAVKASTKPDGKGLYVKLWGTTDPGHDFDLKAFVGLGYATP